MIRSATSASGVCTITLDRPDRLNAVDAEMAAAFPPAIALAAADDAVRVIMITGAGRGFCAGLDLSKPPALPDATRADRLDPLAWVGKWVLAVMRCDVPVIAAVNGAAAGAGFGLAAACDIRVAARSATFVAGYARRGLSPDAGLSYTLPRLIGAGRAADILIAGRDVSATDAQAMGLVAQVFDDDGFAESAMRYAEALATGAPIAQTLTKRLLRASWDAPLESQLESELASIKRCFASSDVAEALRAFSEKRPPTFRGV